MYKNKTTPKCVHCVYACVVERLDKIASNHYAGTDDKKVLGGRKCWGEGIVVVRAIENNKLHES